MNISRSAWTVKPGLLALLFCALLLRTFIPAGYMVGPAALGGAALVLCPDSGPVAASAHHGHHKQAPAQHREAPCPYGALAAPALPPTPVVPMVAAELAAAEPASLASASITRSFAALPPPATGPPVSA